MDKDDEAPAMQLTEEEMAAEGIPLNFRDCCAHLLVPLNRCRKKNYYLPWKCVDERHIYEKCLFEDLLRRKRVFQKRKQEEAAKKT
ncbi:hypothetical protein G9A89_021486 [Geosiphon pyriformis]|nr:hypothetical protein G9A89_021486 [Geosiphon pyriformis]